MGGGWTRSPEIGFGFDDLCRNTVNGHFTAVDGHGITFNMGGQIQGITLPVGFQARGIDYVGDWMYIISREIGSSSTATLLKQKIDGSSRTSFLVSSIDTPACCHLMGSRP